MTTITKNSNSWIAGMFTAIAASLCCISPVLAFLGGASGLASSFSWIEPFRHYLIGLTIAVFAFTWYQKLKTKKQVDCDCETDNKKSFWQSKSFLAIVTMVAGLLIVFPYYTKVFYPMPQEIKVIIVDKSNIATVQLNIKGISCEGCTAHINGELLKVNGVIEANTYYKNANTIVKFDNSKISVDSLSSIVTNIGYKVISSNIINK